MAGGQTGSKITRRITVRGVVQGVGMRPTVARLAARHGIHGFVRNTGSDVDITASGEALHIDAFVAALRQEPPAMADIREIRVELLPHQDFPDFTIIESTGGEVTLLPADFPVCPDCLREMNDPQNRRYRHPFISCTVCGPRYSIMQSAPYDHDTTSMVDFPMCPACASEYNDPMDRRFNAQTVSCHDCGPVLLWRGEDGSELEREDALEAALDALLFGGIVAIKGVGGYHMACYPTDEHAVQKLRALKGRELKPFAVMFADMERLEQFCEADDEERALLASPARPIVLLKTKQAFAPSVNGDARLTGAFLPYTPLQHLLLERCGKLVMTSANRTNQPEIHRDDEMLAMLADGGLSGVLYNARRIVTRLDDSVAKVVAGQRQFIRRSRGYAPMPLPVRHASADTILAYGGDLKAAFCLLKGPNAHMSQYFGDMEELAVQQAYRENLAHMSALFNMKPTVAVHDLHPGYHSAGLARASGLKLVGVQHHHAHVASVMAEHELSGPVLGVAFDGTGYGTDGAVWGGEFLLCEGAEFQRAAHFDYVTLLGGDTIAVDARRAALCYCHAAGIALARFAGDDLLQSAIKSNINTVHYSGCGRLFDAVSSILDICHANGYEGQCATLLENEAHRAVNKGIQPVRMDFPIVDGDDVLLIDTLPVIRAVAAAAQNEKRAEAALGFHEALCRMILAVCVTVRRRTGVQTVALTGGVFQNELLLTLSTWLLRSNGFDVYTNNQVPCNDGGLALGQAWIAAQGME